MRYVIYARGKRPSDEYARQYVPVFEDITKAKTFIITFMGNEPIIPVGNTLEWGDGFTLKADHMEDILNATDGMIDDATRRHILLFKYGAWEKPANSDAITKTPPAKNAEFCARQRKPVVPPGYVSITELASAWGMPASQCRAMLRAHDRVKPAWGWHFDPKEVPDIKKLCGVQ